jgi:ribulose-5-phosphate 4-epimerase/fuculose-1-phosphate aldolase
VAAFRVFAKHNLGVGVVGHLTVRDPGHTECFWRKSDHPRAN